ncbi:hypothetical protein Ahy_B08g093178 [Arachis hypogaea]|uniref:Methyltransferase type 11 domain-containing protein n=1 Tax=Arachis hypogaea TaxID=3818 RepID=A0A444Y5H4_ARAHY|nr:hypothetical protein Ahy_B08g093178 [Arachis hypogaea]
MMKKQQNRRRMKKKAASPSSPASNCRFSSPTTVSPPPTTPRFPAFSAAPAASSPPFVQRADLHNPPFFDGAFDFAFSARLDEALFPARFATEMDRRVRSGGSCIVAVASAGMMSRNYAMDRLNHLNGSKTSIADISDAVNSMTGVSDGGKRCDSGDEDSINKGSSGRKRKRESMSEMLHWILDRAENPCDPAMGSMPKKSKWKSYGIEEIWKQALLFREAVFLKSDHPSWQGQRMHPCMYDDQVGANYNLRERLKTKKSPYSSAEKCSLDEPATVPIPIGPAYQAEVPEWTGMAVESDSKWFGNQIWPAAKRRGYQNRNTPNDINSDDDEAEYGPLKNSFGHNTGNPRTTLLSPKKPEDSEVTSFVEQSLAICASSWQQSSMSIDLFYNTSSF